MGKKSVVLVGILVIIIGIVAMRSCSTGGTEAETTTERYMQCAACGARYELAPDFMLEMGPDDIKMLPNGDKMFRCEECGEVAAIPEIIIKIDGKTVGEESEYEQ